MMMKNINAVVKGHHSYFNSGESKDICFRIKMLKRLRKAIITQEDKIYDALWNDLHKSKEEAYLTEISIVLQEIDFHIKSVKHWAKPKRVSLPLVFIPSYGRITSEPLGVALIIAPWNYPFQLIFNPLIGAISSGCCALIKTSPSAPNTSRVMCEIIRECFDESYISIFEGERDVNEAILAQKFDVIFFTGSPSFGKAVMKAAAENLTPVILELGGKSPCIVDEDANIKVASRRITMGKFLNAGQTCIAPDYIFVHKSKKEELISALIVQIRAMYGDNPYTCRTYARIITNEAFDRVSNLLNQGVIRIGGDVKAEEKYIAPTIIDEITTNDKIMQEEILGPIIPIMTFDKIDECIDYIKKQEKPLALYYFGKNHKRILKDLSFGGGCINDTIMHLAYYALPFGGVGNSGMGRYHGYESFKTFTNIRSIVYTPTWLDLPFKYPPFKYFKLLKKLL